MKNWEIHKFGPNKRVFVEDAWTLGTVLYLNFRSWNHVLRPWNSRKLNNMGEICASGQKKKKRILCQFFFCFRPFHGFKTWFQYLKSKSKTMPEVRVFHTKEHFAIFFGRTPEFCPCFYYFEPFYDLKAWFQDLKSKPKTVPKVRAFLAKACFRNFFCSNMLILP